MGKRSSPCLVGKMRHVISSSFVSIIIINSILSQYNSILYIDYWWRINSQSRYCSAPLLQTGAESILYLNKILHKYTKYKYKNMAKYEGKLHQVYQ